MPGHRPTSRGPFDRIRPTATTVPALARGIGGPPPLCGAQQALTDRRAAADRANDPASFGVQQWNYRWTQDYGSPDVSVADPAKAGRDDVPVPAATLRPDGRTVFLAIPGLRPVMQMSVRYDLDTEEGATLTDTLYLTIHRVPQ